MNFHVLTLFPEMVESGMGTSITGRAIHQGHIALNTVNIRDFSRDEKHHHVDDAPYGGGAGMLMQAEPVVLAVRSVKEKIAAQGRPSPRVIFMTPAGKIFTQKIAEELSTHEDLIFLCGHYEGIDQRALDLMVTDELSLGDFVLTGGELPAMVMMDCISRLVPGVLNNHLSAEVESFHDNLLEYPQYTRPENYMGMTVPPILLSGDHAKVEKWRREQSIRRTYERRPDLLENAALTAGEKEFLEKLRGGETGENKPEA